jgi:TatD DNase family protein
MQPAEIERRLSGCGLRLIDSHVHLDELEALGLSIERARQAGVVAIIAVGHGGSSNRRTLEMGEQYPGLVYPAMGLHPGALAGLGENEVDTELRFIKHNISRVVALGEIGLDYDKNIVKTTSKAWQQDVLRHVLGLARQYGKPVVLHSRYAWKDAFDLVQQSGVSRAVFHWYTGFSNVLDGMLKAGYFISATPAAEYHQEHRRAIRQTPLDSLLLETDAPVYYGREPKYRSEPADILRSLRAVSAIKGIAEAAVAERTTDNACRFFGLAKVSGFDLAYL